MISLICASEFAIKLVSGIAGLILAVVILTLFIVKSKK